MNTENEKHDPAVEKAQAADRPDQDIARGITRFAQYTSPVMLAMLASAGKDMAFAQASNT